MEFIFRYKIVGAILIFIIIGATILFLKVQMDIRALAPIVISLIALLVSIYSVFRDRSKINIGWDICSNHDHSEEWIDIHVTNCGRRPILIQSVGYFDISMGCYVSAANKSTNTIIQPATIQTFKEPMKSLNMWKVGELFVIDEKGKRWSNSKRSRRAFTKMATNCPFDGKHIILSKRYSKYLDKVHKRFLKQINDSPMKNYIEGELAKSREFFIKIKKNA